MPSLLVVIRPMASPIRGSNPNGKVQLGVSITLSRLLNSCTRIAPMVLPPCLPTRVAYPVSTAHAGRPVLTSPLPGGFPAILHGQAARLEGFRGQYLVHGASPGGAGFEQVVLPGRRGVGEQRLAGADGDRQRQQPVHSHPPPDVQRP